jgi:hypothetical protein
MNEPPAVPSNWLIPCMMVVYCAAPGRERRHLNGHVPHTTGELLFNLIGILALWLVSFGKGLQRSRLLGSGYRTTLLLGAFHLWSIFRVLAPPLPIVNQIASRCWKSRRANSNHIPDGTSRSSDTAAGYELWHLCNDHLLFHQSHNAGPIFLLPVTQGQKQGGPHEYLDS